jgi:hypothetical protein
MRSLPEEPIMAMRFVALLIPLAITLPQLQMSRPKSPEPQPPAPLTQPAVETELTHKTRHAAETLAAPVALEPPRQEVVRTTDSAAIETPLIPAVTTAMTVAATPELRKALHKPGAPKLARAASPVKLVAANAASSRSATPALTRTQKRLLANSGCLPNAHCAPVVVAKITPVIRQPM